MLLAQFIPGSETNQAEIKYERAVCCVSGSRWCPDGILSPLFHHDSKPNGGGGICAPPGQMRCRMLFPVLSRG
eukprot:1287154-Rhodomonas_salina.1